MIGYFYLLVMVVLTSIAQFFVKKGSHQLFLDQGLSVFIRSLFSKNILIGGLLTMMAPVFYILALRQIPLSTAYLFSSLNVVIITLVGHLAFREPLPLVRIIGVILIVTGILCFSF